MRIVTSIFIVFGLASCATLFNSKKKIITIRTTSPAHIAINKDTISGLRQELDIVVTRKKDPLFITVYNDTLSRTIKINAKNSLAFWLNAYPGYTFLYGFLIDLKNPKRYTYPGNIYIDIKDSSKYHTRNISLSFIEVNSKSFYFNQLKLIPNRLISDIPGIQISYERQYKKRHATEVLLEYKTDPTGLALGPESKLNGFGIAIEQKYFLLHSQNKWNYVSSEFEMVNCQFNYYHWMRMKDPKDSIELAHQHADTLTIKRRTYTLNLKYGCQLLYKHFVIEGYLGIGIRYRNVLQLNKLHEKDEMINPRHIVDMFEKTVEGKYFNPNLSLGLKIGYRF